MSELSRRTGVLVTFDGADITTSILPYLLSVTYTDSEEDNSDSLTLQLQDREALWLESWLNKAISATAAGKLKMTATIKPESWDIGGGTLPCGSFELDSVSASGPPSTVTIKGASLAFGSAVRQTKKTKAWENYTLSGIANEIAGNAGMECMYEAASNPSYERKEQTKKSDIAFLSDLCHDAGISLKCTDGKLVLFDQSVYEALPPVMTIRRGGGAYNNYSLSTGAAETQYGSCRVSYSDPATGQSIEGTATAEGDDAASEQVLEITARVSSAGEAKELAEKHLRLHNKFNRTATFTLPGNTSLAAGVTVKLEGFGGWDGKYMVKQAEHKVGGGYTVKIDLRKVLGDSAGESGSQSQQSTREAAAPESEPTGGSSTGGGSTGGSTGGGSYTVKSGDSLWKIAKQVYGSGAMWTKIYEANKDVIGSNPNLIFPGQQYKIP